MIHTEYTWIYNVAPETTSKIKAVGEEELKEPEKKRVRGFEPVGGEANVRLPQRLTVHSAAYDFFSPVSVIIEPHQTQYIHTNVKAFMPVNEVLKIYGRSSLAVHNVVLRNAVGIVDADYYGNSLNEGNIIIPLYNDGDSDYTVRRGDRIAQGIFERYFIADDDTVNTTRIGGFGSTGA